MKTINKRLSIENGLIESFSFFLLIQILKDTQFEANL